MPLYEVAIIEKPTEKAAEDGAVEKLLFGPKAVIAKNEQAAALGAVRGELPKDANLDRMEVLVRPFGAR